MSTPHLTRRSLLIGGTGLLGVGTLAACSAGTGGDGDGGGGDQPTPSTLPNYVPFTGPTPDLPGTDDGVNPGFLSYPALEHLVTTVPTAPGDGQPVSAMTPNYSAARPPMDQNSFWKNLNGLLGSDFDAQLVPGADYSNVFATTVASGDLPDLFTLYRAPRLPELLEAEAVDLTDVLAGDGIEAYPNLANIPTPAWQYSIYDGRIRTIPLFRGLRTSSILFQRVDLLEAAGQTTSPQSLDELIEVAKAVTDPAKNRWAFANFPTEYLRQCLGIGNGWTQENGEFTSAWLDERNEAFFEAGLALMEAGVVHPDAFTGQGHKDRFMSGECVFVGDGMSAWGSYYTSVATNFPDTIDSFSIDGVPAFDHDGNTGAPWRGPIVVEQCGIGKNAESRLEVVLGVANYLAAPLGSVEKLDFYYGVEGEHYTMEDGQPIRTEKGGAEWLNLGLLMSSPFEVEASGYPQAVQGQHDFQTYLSANAVANAADGLYSESLVADGGALDVTMRDLTNEILQGRQGVDAWKPAADDYLLSGGDTIAAELADAYAAAQEA